MPQSNVIFAFLAVAFVIFITMRGELRLYMGFLLGSSAGAAPPAPTKTASGPDLATVGEYAKVAAMVLV